MVKKICYINNRWKIFFYLYSENMMSEFCEKNKEYFPKDLLKKLTLNDLMKKGFMSMPLTQNMPNIDLNNLLTNPDKNHYILSNFESFKSLSRCLTNINYPFNNVTKFIYIKY